MSKKIGNIISSLILIVLLAAVSVFVAPKLFGITPMVVLSGSMEPTYPVGSLIFVEKTDPETIEVGDNITYRLGSTDSVVTHRVIKNDVETKQFTTKGDANKSEDVTPIQYSSVVGKAKDFAIPLLGYIGVFMNSAGGYIVIGVLLLTLILVSFLSNDKKQKTGRSK